MKHYCRYHVVFVPNYRKKVLFAILRREIGAIFRDLCRKKGIELVEEYTMRGGVTALAQWDSMSR
ncbi:transposase [Microbulbifer epialgicus]|uniref:Transposase n=1 Tax=Microbulbifer epialgicus TaxID=393907 RepID=A0ABV4P7D5_9GAMM